MKSEDSFDRCLSEAHRASPSVRPVAASDTWLLVRSVADRFGLDAGATWMWASRDVVPSERVDYGADNGVWPSALARLVGARSSEPILVLTEVEGPPIAVRGPLDGLLTFLHELPPLECFFVDDTLDWVVFDTHHDELILFLRPDEVEKR